MQVTKQDCIDDTQSTFIHMLIDRLQYLEESVERLRESSDSRVSDLFLRPETKYLFFSDGYRLQWTLFGEVKMRTNKDDGYHLVPIDERHLNAVVSSTGLLMYLPIKAGTSRYIGHPCRHLKLSEFIAEVQHHIIDETRKGCTVTFRDMMLQSDMYVYLWNLDGQDEFRGLVSENADKTLTFQI